MNDINSWDNTDDFKTICYYLQITIDLASHLLESIHKDIHT